MAINVTDTMQAVLLQSMSGRAASLGGDTADSFGAMLMEAVLGQQDQAIGSAGTAAAYVPDNPYSMMSLMLNSGGSSARSMMLMSLCRALQGNTFSSALGGINTNPYAEVSPGAGIIPSQPWKPVEPALCSNAYNRSAPQYTAVINQFQVETNERYQPDGGTYCNIFVWDVTKAMGAEIPHYYDAKTGRPMSYGDKGANQMNANAMYNWLHEYGDQYGWFEVTPKEAQELADEGHPVVTSLYRSGAHGHVQMVCPSRNGLYDEQRGVMVAQAGRRLTSYRPITQLYSKASLKKVSYFAHM